jgi:dihydroneopterin aldolase
MSTTRLFLTGIGASGRHGANPGEKDEPQDLVVDHDVEVEVMGDRLGSTADYRALIRTARAVVERESFDLLESLAAAVARAVVTHEGVVKATAIVHKPTAARSNDVQGVAAAFTYEG